LQLTGERLRLAAQLQTQTTTGHELNLPLAALSVLWLTGPSGADNIDTVHRTLATARRQRDTVFLRNGDILSGALTALNQQTVSLEDETPGSRKSAPIKIERSKVAAIVLSTELARTLRPRGAYGRLVLANGCRLSLASAHADQQYLTGKTLFGATV